MIGKNCIIGHRFYYNIRVIINDNCKILDDSIITPDTNVPPFTVYGGKPGRIINSAQFISELHESAFIVHKEFCI